MTAFVLQCIGMLASRSPRTLVITLIAAIILAGVCWWICTNYYKLWNNRFNVGPLHLALCGLAALMTLVFTVVFVSLRYTQPIVESKIRAWHSAAAKDTQVAIAIARRAYDDVKKSGLEDFSKVAPFASQEYALPVSSDATRRLASQAYVQATLDDFRRKNPSIVGALRLPAPSIAYIMADRERYLRQNPNAQYNAVRALETGSNYIRTTLLRQAPATVYRVRFFAVLMFLLFQAIPFAVIGWSAYRDLKEQT